MCFWTTTKAQQQQNKKSNIKTPAGAAVWIGDLLHPKQMPYHCTAQSTKSIDCNQAIWLIAMGQNVNKQSQICGPDIFNKYICFCNIFTCTNNYIWKFLILTGVGFAA